jgi:exo-beta-1,3-glucanase (GH17 family)
MQKFHFPLLILAVLFMAACSTKNKPAMEVTSLTAADILGNPAYPAISYGGYRTTSRDNQPTVEELKEDMRIMSAMGIKILRTYNVQFPHAGNVLKAIRELKEADPAFEMYVMLGAWIDCKNAWTIYPPDHDQESEQNAGEIDRAVALANEYPDIVKVIAVGNEAMVKWATSYFVQPGVILKWVKHLQNLKEEGKLSKDLWITSSDNFASWGGGDAEYHVPDLNELIKTVDYLSIHTYPMHDTHYNPVFWGVPPEGEGASEKEQIAMAMDRARDYAISQYDAVVEYMRAQGVDKPVHIGETGWASSSNGFYGDPGSKATDEYKQYLFHRQLREWTDEAGISCFFFEAFDEPWKDAGNPGGSENHFGLFTLEGKAKYALWPLVDEGIFDGLSRGGNTIEKTFNGSEEELFQTVALPPGATAVAQ